MKTTARIGSHPIHPMLIPYPFALLSSATVFDVMSRATGRLAYAQTAQHLATAGLASAVVAAVPGAIDYFTAITPGTRASRSATQHALVNVSALTCFALAQARRGRAPIGGGQTIAFEVAGSLLLALGGWLGGDLVYRERIGVEEDEESRSPGEAAQLPREAADSPLDVPRATSATRGGAAAAGALPDLP
jgi:uncharacterized membrane protein